MTIDLIWKKGEVIVLAMEHENVRRSDPIGDEWRKLINLKANMKVLVSYQSDPSIRKEWIQRASELIKLNSCKLSDETYC